MNSPLGGSINCYTQTVISNVSVDGMYATANQLVNSPSLLLLLLLPLIPIAVPSFRTRTCPQVQPISLEGRGGMVLTFIYTLTNGWLSELPSDTQSFVAVFMCVWEERRERESAILPLM